MYTHMPFLHSSGIIFAAGNMVSSGDFVKWKLYHGESLKSGKRINTGLSEDTIECSPTLTRTESGVALTFIGQNSGDYRFYQMTGKDLANLSPATPTLICGRQGAHAGTRSSALVAIDRPEVAGIEISVFNQSEQIISYEKFGLSSIARITCDFLHPWRMLVSGLCNDAWHTTLYDAKTEEFQRILRTDSNTPDGVYKASICGDSLAYAVRLDDHFEAREIRFSMPGNWQLEPISVTKTRKLLAFNSNSPRDEIKEQREKCLRANCKNGRFCSVCRNHQDTRADLETLGIVDRDGSGCPRGLAWDAPKSALQAIRPDIAPDKADNIWCERFGIGTSPSACQTCVNIRKGDDARYVAWFLSNMRLLGNQNACTNRIKSGRRQLQDCCGQEGKEVNVYACKIRGIEVLPGDCHDCPDQQRKTTSVTVEAVDSC